MATGSYDANGIWQYGEDDNIALFSDLLNLASESTSDAFTDDRARLATLEAGSLAGLIPVIPTSIVVASGSGAISTNGTITLTNAANVSLNGVFSPEYRNYRVIFSATATNACGGFNVKLRSAGTDNSGSYTWVGRRMITWAAGDNWATSQASWVICDGQNGQGTVHTYAFEMDLMAPQVATIRTGMLSNSTGVMEGTGYYGSSYYCGSHNQTASYDGMSIIISGAATYSGTISVYGYND